MSPIGVGLSVLLLQITWNVNAQTVPGGEDCMRKFTMGQENFVLDTEDAVKEGAVLISSPTVSQAQECVSACCEAPLCNLALIEKGAEGDGVKTCVLFNCLYKKKYACRFVNKVGFINYILNSVYENNVGGPESPGEKDPPIANAGRDVVVQPDEKVILNGIESQAIGDSEITSYEWSQVGGDSSIVMEKTNLADQLMVSNLQPGFYAFQLRVTDSNDQSDTANVTVLVLSPEQSDLHCLVPMKVGPCRGAFRRWHYNAASQRCETFTFGGCKGNHNNYLTEKECSNTCEGVTAVSGRSGLPAKEVCGAPCKRGQFVCGNGCCLDKGLECDTIEQCSDGTDESACDQLNRTFTRLLNIDVNQKKARCTEPPRTGPCRASHTRWYYDPLNIKCHRFTYGGCDPNDNNFEEEEKCNQACEGITGNHVFARGMFERIEEEESETESGSIAIAVVLSVAILALLAVLGYCFLKSRKQRSHQPVATNVPHVPFPEDSDTLVYNSTTKPV